MKMIPFDNFIIDCYHNLIMTLFNFNKIEPCLLPCLWPWRFDILNSNYLNMSSFAKDDIMLNVFGLNHIVINFTNYEDYVEKSKEYIDKKEPIIIDIDQFYVSHHYPNIYNKVHGEHSLIVYNGSCVDCMPVYQGEMSESNLRQGIISDLYGGRFHVYEKADNYGDINFSLVKTYFTNFKNAMSNIDSGMSDSCGMNYVIKILETYSLSENDFFDNLESFFKGRWTWEMGKYGHAHSLFIKYLIDKKILDVSRGLQNEIILLSDKYEILFKSLFKSKIKRSYKDAINIINELKNTNNTENNLFYIINNKIQKL